MVCLWDHSDSTLRSHGFRPLVSDPRIYMKILPNGDHIYILVHVDDFLIAAKNNSYLDAVIDDDLMEIVAEACLSPLPINYDW